jgi:hypothetical protein
MLCFPYRAAELDSSGGLLVGNLESLLPSVTYLLSLRTGKIEFWVPVHQIALVGPRPDDLSLCLRPRPEPTRVNVTVANCKDSWLLVIEALMDLF